MGLGECDISNAFPPLVNPAIFLYHLVEYVMFSYHSVTFEIVLYGSINSAIVFTQWWPGRGSGSVATGYKILHCEGASGKEKER